jgi:uncharacterized protein YjiS (DUF1127 family)
MSCGRQTCVPTDFRFDLGTAERVPWLSRVFGILNAALDRERRRQLWIELEKARQRGLLKDLDDRMLADIGVTREQADRETSKPFWK